MVIAFSVIQLLICIALSAIILLQSGKSSGLSGAIAGGSDTFLSKNKSKSFDARLARATKWFAVAFVAVTLVLHLI